MKRLLSALTFALTLTSCGGRFRAEPLTNKWKDYETENKYNSTVTVYTQCYEGMNRGTGVAISRDKIFTARHVVECNFFPLLPLSYPPLAVYVETYNGDRYEAVVEKSGGEYDIASIRLVEGMMPAYMKVKKEKVKIGDQLCYTGGKDMRGKPVTKCGEVNDISYKRGMFWISGFDGIPGNSGGPVYNSNYELVGLLIWRDASPEEVAGCVFVSHIL